MQEIAVSNRGPVKVRGTAPTREGRVDVEGLKVFDIKAAQTGHPVGHFVAVRLVDQFLVLVLMVRVVSLAGPVRRLGNSTDEEIIVAAAERG
jgi:hypothetical protein